MSNPHDAPDVPEPPHLKNLRRLVTLLTATMIAGMAAIFVLMALRLNSPSTPPLPERISLPDGTNPTAFAQTPHYIAITTPTQVLIYTPDGKALKQTITLE
ncbi:MULTISPECIES: DUF6476 family protein [Roseobacteraceae]|jgi:uncharacterized membrane protein|uniref:Uncharacterized protein n=1 Tax=Pseudosulfitobacter pseudonitzschiae TaxID=1402135 RepID=A0A221K1E7_9RHOB|nr:MULTISPECIES: DUF6476 family protein [Roseobacteraceae]ASM72818.1 hypothetical protein SULPSESMR1_02013 [Pseudosulfitobacter pseudonitzschiae]